MNSEKGQGETFAGLMIMTVFIVVIVVAGVLAAISVLSTVDIWRIAREDTSLGRVEKTRQVTGERAVEVLPQNP